MYEDYWDFSFEYCMFSLPSPPPPPFLSFLLCVRKGKKRREEKKKEKRKEKGKKKKERKKNRGRGAEKRFWLMFFVGNELINEIDILHRQMTSCTSPTRISGA